MIKVHGFYHVNELLNIHNGKNTIFDFIIPGDGGYTVFMYIKGVDFCRETFWYQTRVTPGKGGLSKTTLELALDWGRKNGIVSECI